MTLPALTDAHVHLWDPSRFRYPWLAGLPALNRPFLPAEFAAAAGTAHVEKLVFVECGCEPAQSLAEVDWACSLAKAEPRLKGIVARASLEKGARACSDLKALACRP